MDGDPLRDALGLAASRLDVDVEGALEQVGARAGRRRRRQRRVASASVLVGAVVVIAVVLAVAGKGSSSSAPSVTASNGSTVPSKVVYGNLPSRSDAAIAYDDAHGQVVLFGGSDGVGELADTWLWDGHGWSEAHPAVVPPARERAAMAYDPKTKEVVLFGGTVRRSGQTSLALDDTWTWNGTSWTQLHPAHVPPWSSGLAMSYDARSKSVLLLTLPSSHPNLDLTPDGVGSRGDTPFGTWQWNGSDWRELATPSAPLFAIGAVFHGNPRLTPLAHGAGLLFYSWSIYTGTCPPPGQCGGPPDPTNTLDSQTWTWDGTSWTQQHPTHAPGEAQLVVTPGADAAPTVYPPGELTWQWTGSDWFWVKSNDHGARPDGDGFAVYDDAERDVVAYAGRLGSDGAFYDTWTWHGSWTKRTGSTTAVTTPTTAPTTTTSSPSPVPCTSAQLRVFLARDLGSTMQQPGAYFGLTNRSSTPCTVDGYPTLTLYDASGRMISADMIHSSSYQIFIDPGAHRVVVERGATVYFGFGWTDANQTDGGSQKGCVSIASVRVLVPGTSRSLGAAAPLRSVFCPPGGEVTAIAPRAAFPKGEIP
jgi:Protein of unknown function (DUF4232)